MLLRVTSYHNTVRKVFTIFVYVLCCFYIVKMFKCLYCKWLAEVLSCPHFFLECMIFIFLGFTLILIWSLQKCKVGGSLQVIRHWPMTCIYHPKSSRCVFLIITRVLINPQPDPTEKTIERSPFFVLTWGSLLPQRPGWTDNLLNFFSVACRSLSLVAVACFFLAGLRTYQHSGKVLN